VRQVQARELNQKKLRLNLISLKYLQVIYFRAETASGSDIGEELKKIMSSGKFVSDDVVLGISIKKNYI
jgi:adenylate kinase family enzyme